MVSPEHSPPQPCPCVGLRFKSVPPAWPGKPETEELTEWKALGTGPKPEEALC